MPECVSRTDFVSVCVLSIGVCMCVCLSVCPTGGEWWVYVYACNWVGWEEEEERNERFPAHIEVRFCFDSSLVLSKDLRLKNLSSTSIRPALNFE